MGKVIEAVLLQKMTGWKKEIVVIDDGSTDNSGNSVQKFLARNAKTSSHIQFIQHAQNYGMGKTLQTGIIHAKGDVILFQDADCEYHPKDIPALLAPFKNPEIQVVYGSRYLQKSKRGYYLYYSATRFFTWFINRLYHTHLTDAFTGYKLFRTNILKQITSIHSDFAFNVDITTKILKHGIAIHEVPISYTPRSFSEGKKISPWIGVKDVFIIVKNRL